MKMIFLFFLIVLPISIFAQSNYIQGYAVKNNGDTLKGYMDYKQWRKTPKSVDFKQAPANKEIIKLSPADVKSIHFTNYETYISYVGTLSAERNTYPDLLYILDTTRVRDTVFLKILVEGDKVSLLVNAGRGRNLLFTREGIAAPQELKYHQYFVNSGDRLLIQTSDRYKVQLMALIQKYAPPDNQLSSLLGSQYNEDDIEKLIVKINGVSKTTIRESHSRLFVGAGANFNTTSFSGPNGFGFTGKSNTVSPTANVGLDLFSNSVVQQSFFRLALSFSSLSPGFAGSVANYKFTQYSIGLAPQYVYNVYNTDNLKYFISGGGSANYAFYANNQMNVTEGGVILTPDLLQNLGDTYAAYKKGDVVNSPYPLHSFTVYFSAKTGVVLNNKIEVYLAYNISAINFLESYNLNNNSLRIGINFLFNNQK